MEQRLVNAWYRLLGRGRETPGERACRHERERGLRPYMLAGGLSIAITLVANILSPVSLGEVLMNVGSAIAALVLLLSAMNVAIKWHQEKYGGD
jgi:hypothetical protein